MEQGTNRVSGNVITFSRDPRRVLGAMAEDLRHMVSQATTHIPFPPSQLTTLTYATRATRVLSKLHKQLLAGDILKILSVS